MNRIIKRILNRTTPFQKRQILMQLVQENENMTEEEKTNFILELNKIEDKDMKDILKKVIDNLEADSKCLN